MAFFDADTRRFALRIVLPAVVISVATFAIVVISLGGMADEVNRIENTLTARSTTAAIAADLRRFGELNNDNAQWDDAVRNLYGEANADWAAENMATSLIFDTVYLVDENGRALLAYRNGEPVSTPPGEAFGPSLATMIAELPTDGADIRCQDRHCQRCMGARHRRRRSGRARRIASQSPPRSRYLVIGKAFDDAAVARLGEDFRRRRASPCRPGRLGAARDRPHRPERHGCRRPRVVSRFPRQPRQGRGQPGRRGDAGARRSDDRLSHRLRLSRMEGSPEARVSPRSRVEQHGARAVHVRRRSAACHLQPALHRDLSRFRPKRSRRACRCRN